MISSQVPKVSVVIPTYNRPTSLSSAIVSVLNQEFQDFEIIVVDDASKDDSAYKIVCGFNDNRLKYIRHEKNKGGGAARNTGIIASKGKYIALLDDDDEWLSKKLQVQVDSLDNSSPDVGVIYTGYIKIDSTNGKVIKRKIPTERGNIFNELLIRNCVGTASLPLLRKECFDKVGLFDESLCSYQDWDMWIRISKVFHFEFIKEPLVKYYVHKNKISTNLEALINGEETFFKKYGKLLELNRKIYSYHYFILGTYYCYNKNIKKGRKTLLSAIRTYPFNIRYYINLGCSLLGANAFKELVSIKKRVSNSAELLR